MSDYILVDSDITSKTLKSEYNTTIVSSLSYIHTMNKTHSYEQDTVACTRGDGTPYNSTMPVEIGIVYDGWRVEVISDVSECYIDFTFSQPVNIVYVTMKAPYNHFETYTADCDSSVYLGSQVTTITRYSIGNFKIQGSNGGAWADLYTGSNTTNVSKTIYMTSNTEYYTRYRILILNNSSLTTPSEGIFDKNYYAINELHFYRSSTPYTPPVPDIYIQTPTNITPANEAVGVGETPTLSVDAFVCVNGTDTHTSSDWQVSTVNTFTTTVWESLTDTTNLESIEISSGLLSADVWYYWRCKYTGATYDNSSWSTATSFTTEVTPTEPPETPEPPEAGMENTGSFILYAFDNDISCRKIHIQGVQQVDIGDSPFDTFYDTNTNVDGTITISIFEEGDLLSCDVDKSGESTDYCTTVYFSSTVSGIAAINGTTIIDTDSLILPNGRMDVAGNTVVSGGYIYATLYGQQSDIEYSDNDYNILTEITYRTTVSGEIGNDFAGIMPVTGYTNRQENRTSSLKASGFKIGVTNIEGAGSISVETPLYLFEQKADLEGVEFSTHDSIVFEITQGEAYDCRLTAWDDVTHSTTLNYLISGDYVRVSALAFRAEGTVLAPESSTTINNYIASPVYNRIFKGNVVYNGTNYYYGDFDLSHRTEPDMIGDYLIFKPMLYGVDDSIPYGIHDHVIVLHYNYT